MPLADQALAEPIPARATVPGLARFNQTDFESKAAKERAQKKILRAAERGGVEVDEDSNVRQPVG